MAKAVGEGGLVHQQQNIMRHRPMVDLIERLGALPFAEDNGLDAWFFWNSGAEAVEASLKLARQVRRVCAASAQSQLIMIYRRLESNILSRCREDITGARSGQCLSPLVASPTATASGL